MKLVIQFLFMVALFFGTWFALRQIDWMTLLNVQQGKNKTEEKLGKLFWDLFSKRDEVIHSKEIEGAVDTLVTHLCKTNDIDRSKIKLHILRKDEVNAFTLPDNHLVVLTGLIAETENEAELMGVIAHEIAHMEKNHVMKRLVKEIGLSVLISMTSGGGGETIAEAAKFLSSTAYDRDLEREADMTAVDYLLKAEVDPEGFANFLYRLGQDEEELPRQLFWITTHPDSKGRAEDIIEYLKGKSSVKKPVLTMEQWQLMQASIAEED